MVDKDLHIDKTDESPSVHYTKETGVIRIEGRSLLENPFQFYSGLIEWMKEFVDKADFPVTMEIFLDYFNSSSGRYLLEFLLVADQRPSLFNIKWIAEEDDEVMIEKGGEFKYILQMPMRIEIANNTEE